MDRSYIKEINRDFLVVYKPAGLPVQTARVDRMDLEHWLLRETADETGRPYLAVVHRLDQPVEGLLVFARNRKAAANLSRQVQEGEMVKEYLAVTSSPPEQERGRLTDFLKKDGKNNVSRVVEEGTPGGKRAELQYECLQVSESGQALVRIRLMTGRHHQIRVQLAQAGMPIAGDRKYGGDAAGAGPLALCAWKLKFRHPVTGEELLFQCRPAGEQFQNFNGRVFGKD